MPARTRNKWLKYRLLKRAPRLAPYMPRTRLFTSRYFYWFLSKYNRLVVKPNGGMRGKGVYKITPLGNGRYEIHHENTRGTIEGKEDLYRYLTEEIEGRSYIVQRYIPLAKVNNRPFDMRVIVQRRRHSNAWRVTGKVAKVAGKGYMVTNITRSNGTLLPISTALKRSSVSHLSAPALLAKISRVALRAARRLRKMFPNHRIYGLDMGLDQNGHLWIIEANLYPAMSHFRKMKDYKTLRRIKAYKKG